MIKHLLSFFLVLIFFFIYSEVGAQQTTGRLTDKEKLKKIAIEEEKKYNASREKALLGAKKHNWAITHTAADGSTISLQGVTQNGRPIYYVTDNAVAAKTTNTSNVWGGGSAGLNISGSHAGLAGKLGIWDGGAVRPTHQEYHGRIVNRDNTPAVNSHATHVAGTMIAKGLTPSAKGMAYGIADLQSWKFDNDGPEIAGAASSLLLSNHSYGFLAGWRFINGSWYWLGDINVSETEDVYFGYYEQTAQLWDNIAYHAPYYLMVKAAGNSNNNSEPAVGTPYFRFNPSTGNWESVAARSPDMRTYSGYDVIPDHSVSKNILSIGAIHGLTNGYTQPSDVVIASFSSWGPTDDGRIKPDLVGDGVKVVSTFSGADTQYASASGTSMASPNVSGALVLFQDHFATLNKGSFMRAATLKGLAIHTAQEAGTTVGPDYTFGWGVLNTEQGIKVISNANKTHQLLEATLIGGTTFTQQITASGTEPLRATISWTDPAGAVLPLIPSTLNNRTPSLVNDLDIRITSDGVSFLPWVLDPNDPAKAATTGDNIRDNVEQILISNPTPGTTYTLTVTHKNSLFNANQDFSLVLSGLQGLRYCPSASKSIVNSSISQVVLGTTINASDPRCSVYTDNTAILTNVEAGKTLPVEITLGNCGTLSDNIIKIFVDWNEDGDFDDEKETAATSPVISGVGSYSTFILVPADVIIGNTTRMRVVLQETTNPEVVLACGNYVKGETEDYTLKFVAPTSDVGITAITLPGSTNFYKNPTQSVSVKIRNYGSVAQSNIPVSVTVTQGGMSVATLSGTYPGSLKAYEETTFLVPQTFASDVASTYQFVAATLLPNDLNSENDGFTASRTTALAGIAPVITASSCESNPNVLLKGAGAGTIFWYDALTGGNLLGVGNSVLTPHKPGNRKYFAAVNDYIGTTGILQNNTAGTFASDTASIFFNANYPFLLDKVTIQVQTAGTLNILLLSPNKAVVASTQLHVFPGIAEYSLNFSVPTAGNKYRLLINSFSGASLNRNNASGILIFPDTSSPVVTLTGTSGAATHFYFYNWQIRANGSSSNRVGVKANGTLTSSVAAVCAGTNTGTLTLSSFPGNILRWEKSEDGTNWTAINHTGSTYAFLNLEKTTLYRALVTETNCAEAISDTLTVKVNPLPEVTITNSGNSIVCPDEPVTLTSSLGSSYFWSTGETTRSILVNTAGTYTVSVKNEHGCSATAAPITIITNQTSWHGAYDSNWFDSQNWSCRVPDATVDVTIPAGLERYPVITTGTAFCYNLTVLGQTTLQGGALNISGNFTNTGIFSHITGGTLELKGSTNQVISGGPFLHLTIDNQGLTTLASDISVNGNLQLTNGKLHTGTYKITLGPSASIREDDTNYITGKVEAVRNFSNPSTPHSFGNLGAKITTPSTPGDISVTRFTNTNELNALKFISRYYAIQVVSGSTADLNATLEFSYLPHELGTQTKSDLILFRSVDNGQNWERKEASVASPEEGLYKVTLHNIVNFSSWTAGNRSENVTLPVTLLSFNAQNFNQDVILTWTTASEKNSKGFDIEVSPDAVRYRSLGFIPSLSAFSQSRQSYRFTDEEKGKSGIRYYRLKQTDLDGKMEYFGPKAVNFNQITPKVTIYPNPTSGLFQLKLTAPETENMNLEIRDLAGKIIYNTSKKVQKGINTISIKLPGFLAKGLYQLIIVSGQVKAYHKLILE